MNYFMVWFYVLSALVFCAAAFWLIGIPIYAVFTLLISALHSISAFYWFKIARLAKG